MKTFVLFTMIIVSIGFFAVSCQSIGLKEADEENQFYYYPQKNVYFNVDKKTYYYSLDGGRDWDSVASVSDKEPVTLGGKIMVYSKDESVYKDNAAHRKLYNGRLFDIIDPDTSFASIAPEATERKMQKPIATNDNLEEDEPIKGLTKFLKKVFGKHNKKKEDK